MSNAKKIKALIVEDEDASRKSLRLLLEKFCPEIEVMGEAINVEEASQIVRTQHPELVFLDIKLSEDNGFRLLDAFQPLPFKVIFTTAYDEFATKAFRYSVLDYLLKPIHFDELIQAVEKYKSGESLQLAAQQLDTLAHNLKNLPPRVALPTKEGFQFVELEAVVRCEADSNYTRFYLSSSKKILTSRSLKVYEDMLASAGFFRIHRSHLINMKFLDRYRRGKHPEVEMADGAVLALAPFRKELFESYLDMYVKGRT